MLIFLTANDDEFRAMNKTFLTVGLALSFILALIALLNFINAVITSIQSRKSAG